MNDELREELYNEMIQNYNELSHDEIINVLEVLENPDISGGDYTKELLNNKDYLRNEIDIIIKDMTFTTKYEGSFPKIIKINKLTK